MAFIVPIFMLSIAYFTGLTVMKLFCDDKTSIIETCLVGTFFLMIISQIVVLICYYFQHICQTYVHDNGAGTDSFALYMPERSFISYQDQEKGKQERSCSDCADGCN